MILFCCSCTKVVYTTSQYLSEFQTKNDVIGRFGLPNEKRQEGYTTEWLYDFGSVEIRNSYTMANGQATINAYGNSVYGNANGSGSNVQIFTNYQRYLKFTFNGRDRVTSYTWQGVNFDQRKAAPGKTIALVVVSAAAIAAIIILAGSGDGGY